MRRMSFRKLPLVAGSVMVLSAILGASSTLSAACSQALCSSGCAINASGVCIGGCITTGSGCNTCTGCLKMFDGSAYYCNCG